MGDRSLKAGRLRWAHLVVAAGGLALVLYVAPRLRAPAPPAATSTRIEVLTVPLGGAGKAGELQVTEEAMKLAEIEVQAATARMVAETLSVSGAVQAGGDQLVKVTPRSPGKVVKIHAGVGDTVRAGQTLALLESSELAQAQARCRQARAQVAAAQASLKRQSELARLGQFGLPQMEESRKNAAEAEQTVFEAQRNLVEEQTKLAEAEGARQALLSLLSQAKSELGVARSRMDRAESLYEEELISKQELERIRADANKAESDVEVARANAAQGEARIKGAKARIQAAEGELSQARRRAAIAQQSLEREEQVYKGQFLTSREIVEAETVLDKARVEAQGAEEAVRILGGTPGGGSTTALTSPIDGRIQDRTATLGETIDPEHAAFTVVNLDSVWAQLAVAPSDLEAVRVGQRVVLESESAANASFEGKVLAVGTEADEATRSVFVRTTLGNRSHLLKPGSFVKGTIVTDLRARRVTVPDGALQDHTGRATVYVAGDKPGSFEIRHVTLGIRGDGWREISAGLLPGERVAVKGTFYLKSEALKSSLSDGCCAPGG